ILKLCLGGPELRTGRAPFNQSKGENILRPAARTNAMASTFHRMLNSFETLNEVRRIWIAASRLEDSTRQWTGYFFVPGRSLQRVRVFAVERELTSLIMHRRPRGYDPSVSLYCQL